MYIYIHIQYIYIYIYFFVVCGVRIVCDNQEFRNDNQEVRNENQPNRNKADTIRHYSDNNQDEDQPNWNKADTIRQSLDNNQEFRNDVPTISRPDNNQEFRNDFLFCVSQIQLNFNLVACLQLCLSTEPLPVGPDPSPLRHNNAPSPPLPSLALAINLTNQKPSLWAIERAKHVMQTAQSDAICATIIANV